MAKKINLKAFYLDADDSIRKRKLIVGTGGIDDDKNSQSWHLFERLLVRFPQLGYAMAILSPRVEIPLSPFLQLKPKEQEKLRNISTFAEENLERRDMNIQKQNRKNKMQDMIMIILLLCGVTFMMVALLKGCGTSNIKFKMPGT